MRSRFVLPVLTIGVVAGLFACQDRAVIAPDDDVVSPDDLVAASAVDCDNPKFANHPSCPGGGEDPPSGGPTLTYTGVFSGTAEEGVSWSLKKGLLSAFVDDGYITVQVSATGPEGDPFEMADCRVWPEGAEEAALPLLNALNSGQLTGMRTNARVDIAVASVDPEIPGSPSADNRIFSFHGGDLGVRYFWIGSWYETSDETNEDARVKGLVNDETHAEWIIEGGAIGLRNLGGPKDAVKLHCPNGGQVEVSLTKG